MVICPSVIKRYEGVGGGLRQRYVTSFFSYTAWFPRVRRGFLNNLASIFNNMFLCIMFTTKTGSHITNYP